jgi:putative ATP-dependent endonuclease of OLD family
MVELSSSTVAKSRATSWKATPTALDVDKMLKDVDAIGKGRFAQRWAQHISRANRKSAPQSVLEALEYVASRVRFPPVPEGGDGTQEEP